MKQSRRKFVLTALGTTSAAGLTAGKSLALGGTSVSAQRRFSYLTISDDAHGSCCDVSLERLRSGEVLAAFRRAPKDADTGEILLARSAEGGKTWGGRSPTTIFTSEPGSGDDFGHHHAGISQLSDGALVSASVKFSFLFNGEISWKKGSEISGVFARKSDDQGRTWTERIPVSIDPFRVAWLSGRILELKEGRLLMPLSGQKGNRYSAHSEAIVSFLLRSDDRAETWQFHAEIAADTGGAMDYDQPCLTRLQDGRLLCFFSGHDGRKQDPLGGYFLQSMSEDAGLTWSEPAETRLWGHCADLITLRDGRVLCTYGYRIYPGPGIRGCVSEEGTHWDPDSVFGIKLVSDLPSNRMQFGNPSSVQLASEEVLTAYHLWKKEESPPSASEGSGLRRFIEGAVYRP